MFNGFWNIAHTKVHGQMNGRSDRTHFNVPHLWPCWSSWGQKQVQRDTHGWTDVLNMDKVTEKSEIVPTRPFLWNTPSLHGELEWHLVECIPPPGWTDYIMYSTDRPDLNPDLNRYLIDSSSSHTQPVHQISSESIHNVLRYPTRKIKK